MIITGSRKCLRDRFSEKVISGRARIQGALKFPFETGSLLVIWPQRLVKKCYILYRIVNRSEHVPILLLREKLPFGLFQAKVIQFQNPVL